MADKCSRPRRSRKNKMNKIVLGIIVLLILTGAGFVGYKYFFSGSSNQAGGPPSGAQLCDVEKESCGAIPVYTNSGTLEITISGVGRPVSGLEVDIGDRPGATKFYMSLTDANGVAVFGGIPAGDFTVYFNGNTFPGQFGEPPLQTVSVISGQTTKININLSPK